MKRITMLTVLAFLSCLTAAAQEQSQEKKTAVTPTPIVAPHPVPATEIPSADAWKAASESVVTASWQPEQTTQELPSVVDKTQTRKERRRKERELNREVRQLRVTIGNTSMDNWSPFPDRMLDARTLSFPLPRKP